jgi:TPP-dependent indolepyruvate ferredoxin oxidoreductase alpha subunit
MRKEQLLDDAPASRILALENEAVARGGLEAGVHYVTG